MTTRVLLAVVLLSSIFSFAQNKDAASSRDSAQPTAPAPKAADSSSQFAYLHVYRARRYMGSALAPTIIVDTTKVARVGSGRRFTAKLAPGTHMVLSDDKSSAITVEAVAGQHYYIRVDEETGFWKGHGKLTMIVPEQGKPEYSLQKPIEADRRLAKEMLEEDAETAAPGGKS